MLSSEHDVAAAPRNSQKLCLRAQDQGRLFLWLSASFVTGSALCGVQALWAFLMYCDMFTVAVLVQLMFRLLIRSKHCKLSFLELLVSAVFVTQAEHAQRMALLWKLYLLQNVWQFLLQSRNLKDHLALQSSAVTFLWVLHVQSTQHFAKQSMQEQFLAQMAILPRRR
ncbi:hypothetical protein STEG23_004126 [Scotinomys teguina]